MKKEIFIHIGTHKTGTTFLQQGFFSKLENVNFIDLSKDMVFGVLEIELKEGKNLISRESLSGKPYYFERPYLNHKIIERLKRVYPDAKIIIGFRKKDDWVYSLYRQHMKYKPIKMSLESFKEKLDPRYLNYENYVKTIKEHFKDVYIYYYEDLKGNFDIFIDNFCKFLDVERPDNIENVVYNKGFNESQINILRALYGFQLWGYKVFKYLVERSNRK